MKSLKKSEIRETKYSKKINVFVSPHFHYDYLWCDTPDGMGAKSAKIIKEALLLMRKYSDYKYVIDSVMPIEYFKLHFPEMVDELKQRVKEKRIELIGGMIIAPDTLMPNGESLVRQVLYGTEYFKKNFNVDSKIGYLLDSFGQTPQLPQILKKAGFEFFIFWRGANNRNLPSEFYWRALDGSKILTHWLSCSYTWLVLPFTGTILPPVFPFSPVPFTLNFIPQNFKVYEIIKKIFPPFKFLVQKLNTFKAGVNILGADMSAGMYYTINKRIKRATTNNIFILNGTDNLPPSSNIVDVVDYLQKKSKKYNIKIALPSEFLRTLKNSLKKIGILGPYEFSGFPDKFPGTYSCRIKLKQKIRKLENLFYLAELSSTYLNIIAKKKYPKELIKKSIWRLLCCDFHDGICGCHVDAVYNEIMKMLKLSEYQLKRILKNALSSLADAINITNFDKNSIPLLIFNPLSTIRTEAISIKVPKDITNFKIRDEDGNNIAFQKDELSHEENCYIIIANDIPSVGYKVYFIETFRKTQKDLETTSSFSIDYSCNNNLIQVQNDIFSLTFENNRLRTITDKRHDFTIKASDYFINDLRIFNDRGDSYLHGKMSKKIFTTFNNHLKIIESGPVRTVIQISSELQCKNKFFFKPLNEILQYIILYNFNIPRIDFICKFKNKIRNVRIQVCFPINFKNPKFYSEVPYGYIERDITPTIGKSWADFKKRFSFYDRIFPVINWMDVSDSKQGIGISIINYGLPEYEIASNKDYLFLTLLKSTGYVGNIFPGAVPMVLGPFYNIPRAYELGDHQFHYSLFFHNGKIKSNNIPIQALRHNVPLFSSIVKNHNGNLKNSDSFIKIEPSNFLITVIKKPEGDNEGIIIRVFETSSKKSKGKITVNRKIKSVHLVNLLEIPIKNLEIENNNSFSFNSMGQEILTFLIKI
ncbi:MAG: alpha-mannosidase [Promethearchaeota archaeon]